MRPTPSPDGRKIAFVRREATRSKLYVKDLTSGEERKIYDALDQDVQETWAVTGVYPNMDWTPDSKSVVFWAGGKIRRVAAREGASTLNVPDTVGYSTPDEIFELFSYLDANVERGQGTIFSAHCHDDLGLACANSLAAIRAGARQVECTLHGIGERAGNCAMEEIVMALRTRPQCFGVATAIDIAQFGPASRMLTEVTGIAPAPLAGP